LLYAPCDKITAEMVASEAHKGLLNLFERGLIPRAANLTLDPNPVIQHTVALHDRNEQQSILEPAGRPLAIEHKPKQQQREQPNDKKKKQFKKNKADKDAPSQIPHMPVMLSYELVLLIIHSLQMGTGRRIL
jgi:hypothetical protein